MRLTLITPPAAEPITLDDLKQHLRIDHNDEDDLLMNLIAAARQKLDGPRGLLGRCLITQEWKAILDGFPPMGRSSEIVLPFAPVSAVSAITYRDPARAELTLAPDAYLVTGLHDDAHATIGPTRCMAWPYVVCLPGSVTVTFKAGYGEAPEDIPEPIRQAIRIHAASLYENRESASLPPGWFDLISEYRVQAF
ncbi:head-tail connector protein [Microvirga sp. 2YAF29]|uniref:head-tail connector protein n=1 Tax=Microvirga sp. 2YAF29 TaxID=3233031 RepID=UPI003F97060C